MSTTQKVIWSEGMFLHPHHFQQQDRHVEDLIQAQTRLLQPYYWGVSELKIDEQLLLLGKFALNACQGVLPDGTFFNIPSHDKPPASITVPAGTTNTMVYLGLPSKRAGTPEVTLEGASAQDHGARYQTETVEISDSNFGSEVVTPLKIGRLHLRLLLSKEDHHGFECLGLARISEVRTDGKILLDENYLPPCLNIQAIPTLCRFLQEIQGLIHYRGNVLMQRISEQVMNGLSEITDFLLLQIANRFEPLILHLSYLKSLHPEEFFKILIQIAGELATFTNEQRRPISMPKYLHNDLQSSFLPLMAELRRGLSIVIEENALSLKLEEHQANTWISTLNDKTLLDKATFILAVSADMPLDELRKLFPAQTKTAPAEEIRQLILRALSGIDLIALSSAPRQIPFHANYVYFSFNERHAFWQQLKNSAALAIQIGGDFPGLKMELWAIKDKNL